MSWLFYDFLRVCGFGACWAFVGAVAFGGRRRR